MALLFSNTVDRTLERLRTAFVDTARGAREAVGAPLRPDLPDDDIPRLKSRIDACLEGKGGETARQFGNERSAGWDAAYAFFVGLYGQGRLGGGRFVARRSAAA